MATIIRRRGSRIWTAFFRDETGRLHCRSTKKTDRKEARKVADQYEDIARNKRTLEQIIRVIGDLHRQTGGKGELATITVRQHVESWLKAKEGELADASRKFFRASAQRFVDYLGEKADRCLFEITKSDIVAFRDQLAAQVSPTTTDHLMTTVKALFKSATAEGLIADDPAEFVRPVKKEKRGQGKRGFTLDELRAVLGVADHEWRSMIMFGLYSGQRLRDLATLSWNNIDLTADVIRLETAKTHRTMTIPIAAPLRQHIESLLECLPNSDDPGSFIHPRCAGKPQPALSSEFSRILVSAGLRKTAEPSTAKAVGLRRSQHELSFHSLRHSAVSMLHEAGIPMAVVLEFVGHSSASMSSKYTHTGLENLRKAASALPKI